MVSIKMTHVTHVIHCMYVTFHSQTLCLSGAAPQVGTTRGEFVDGVDRVALQTKKAHSRCCDPVFCSLMTSLWQSD
jgi:short subunit fatty acids transporter